MVDGLCYEWSSYNFGMSARRMCSSISNWQSCRFSSGTRQMPCLSITRATHGHSASTSLMFIMWNLQLFRRIVLIMIRQPCITSVAEPISWRFATVWPIIRKWRMSALPAMCIFIIASTIDLLRSGKTPWFVTDMYATSIRLTFVSSKWRRPMVVRVISWNRLCVRTRWS